ncbi:MAG TPA: CheR family methyltransferase [Candidatus Acidoferrales bacterium]|nr:CheR family methyltransferase [Candidatus Acidoferrales bacterium]
MTGTTSVLNRSTADRQAGPPDPSLVRIRDLIYRVCGIYMPDNKMFFLQDRLNRRLRELQMPSLRSYQELLTSGKDRDTETRNLLNEITVGETTFFRNVPQLTALQKIVIPKLLAAKANRSSPHLKFWSAGCSTGEEPYTLAIFLLENSASLLRGCGWEIVATDLNDHSLAKAREGVYDGYAVRNVEPALLLKYFRRQDEQFQLSAEVKKRVSFTRLNLQNDAEILSMRAFDVIFCANVLIYFDSVSKRRALLHFFTSLLPGGYFFLGHSESLFGITDQFHLVHFPGATAYFRPAANAGPGGQS